MTVIYVDTLFLLNGIVDYLLLLAAAKVAGEALRRLRFALGAVLGGLYAVAVFLPGLGFLSHPLCRICAAVLMGLAAYGGSRRLFRQLLIFFALTCAFAGGVLAIALFGGKGLTFGAGIYYSEMDLKIVLLSTVICYILLTLLFRRWGKHTHAAGQLLDTRVLLQGRQVTFPSLLDTGNTLTDPISGSAVMVAEGDAIQTLLPGQMALTPQDLLDPAGTLARLEGAELAGRVRLMPYRAVGVAAGLLLAIRPDQVWVGERDCGQMLVALSPTPVSDGGAYRALVGPLD